MLEELSSNYPETVDKIQQATHAMKELATHLKNNRHVLNANMNDSLLLDSPLRSARHWHRRGLPARSAHH